MTATVYVSVLKTVVLTIKTQLFIIPHRLGGQALFMIG